MGTQNTSKLMKYLFSLYDVSHKGHNAIVPLEGLRAIAAFMVFIVHYTAQFTPWIIQNSVTWDCIVYFRHIGSKGVALFFVISGFLIYGMLLTKNDSILVYLKKRIKRIYPTFLVVLVIYLCLSFLFPSESKLPESVYETIKYIIFNIFLIPGILPIEPIVRVSWSLSYEIFFYISIPLVIYFFHFKKHSKLYRVLILLLATIIGFILVHYKYDSHSEIIIFISGMLLYEFYQLEKIKKIAFNYSFITTILAIIIIKYYNLSYTLQLLTLFVGFFLVCISCFNPKTQLAKICSSPLLRCYGNMSYSYYLIHGLTLKFLFYILNYFIPANHQWDWALYFLFIPMFIVTWCTSTGLFLLVEKPFSLTKKIKSTPVTQEN